MNAELVQQLVDSGVLRTLRIIAAFEAIDRKDFVPGALHELAYADHPLSIGHGATISQPTTVAFMLELLQPEIGDRILDVGSGSGWTSALLKYLVDQAGTVVAVELEPALVKSGTKNLQKYFPLLAIKQADEVLGAPEDAPFDKILVSASAQEIPHELVAQLRVGGRMVIPVQDTIVRIDRFSEEKFQQETFPGYVFVPLR